jgi:hypothetical protein
LGLQTLALCIHPRVTCVVHALYFTTVVAVSMSVGAEYNVGFALFPKKDLPMEFPGGMIHMYLVRA